MFTYLRRTRYYETDSLGIVHHTHYVNWMEEASVEFLKAAGYGYKELEAEGLRALVIGYDLTFRRPVFFDDEIEVRTRVLAYSGLKIEISYTFYNVTRDEVSAEGVSRHCFTKDGAVLPLRRTLPDLDAFFRKEAEA